MNEVPRNWQFDPARYAGHAPGPWCTGGVLGQNIVHRQYGGGPITSIAVIDLSAWRGYDSNRNLIMDAPILLAEVIRLRSEVERLEESCRN